jgi:TonB family protein
MTPGPRPALALTLFAVTGALLTLAQPARAQPDAAKPGTGLERAQKAADAVFHWIKLNADKGASRQAPAPAPAVRKPAPAPVPAAPRPAPAQNTAQSSPQAQAPAPSLPAVANAPAPEPQPDAVLLASAAPMPAPDAPLSVATQAAEPPASPPEAAEEPLQLLHKVAPTFPRQLLQQNVRNGFAQIQFTVAADGTVSQAQSVKSSHSRLGSAAVEAVRQWRFAPIGRPREVAVEVAFNNNVD